MALLPGLESFVRPYVVADTGPTLTHDMTVGTNGTSWGAPTYPSSGFSPLSILGVNVLYLIGQTGHAILRMSGSVQISGSSSIWCWCDGYDGGTNGWIAMNWSASIQYQSTDGGGLHSFLSGIGSGNHVWWAFTLTDPDP